MTIQGRGIAVVKSVARRCGIDLRRVTHEPVDQSSGGEAQNGRPLTPANTLALAISDVVLRKVLAGGKPSDFTFVQIGANDGVSNDPIRRYVLLYGFRGVLIEPQPDVFARLQSNYAETPGIAFENAAIAAQNGQLEMYRFKKSSDLPVWADGLASFSKETLLKNFQGVAGAVETLQVPTISIASMLRKHGLTHLDLLQIDAEGFDFEIIKMINFSEVKPTIIHFEHGFLNESQQIECFRYLEDRDYRILNNADNTVAYAEPDEQSHARHVQNWVATSAKLAEARG